MQELKVREMQQSQSSKEDAIEVLLTGLSTARQAKIGDAEFDLYVPALMKYDLTIIHAAIVALSLKPRADGETAFPALGTILAAVRDAREAQGESRASQEIDRLRAHKAANPDHYTTSDETKAMVAELSAKFSMDAKPREIEIRSSEVCCPHCEGKLPLASNLRFMSSTDLRMYADALDAAKVKAEAEVTR